MLQSWLFVELLTGNHCFCQHWFGCFFLINIMLTAINQNAHNLLPLKLAFFYNFTLDVHKKWGCFHYDNIIFCSVIK